MAGSSKDLQRLVVERLRKSDGEKKGQGALTECAEKTECNV
jgi:hypothetical protein